MPAKQEVKNSHYSEEVSTTSSSQDSPSSIIRKLYGAVLDNRTVKSGMKRVHSISQPLLDKYHEVLVEGRQKVDGVSERVKSWCYSITIYNHFVGLWLIENLPYNEQVVSYERFLQSFQDLSKDTSEESRRAVDNFYREASKYWVQMRNPALEDIKSTCLLIAAHAIASDNGIALENYSSTLVEVFYSLEEKQNDVITEEAFYLNVIRRIQAEEEDQKDLRRATKEFYTFAKRFSNLEFPLTYANHNLLTILIKFTRENADVVAGTVLSRVDRVLDLVIKNFGVDCEAKERPTNLVDYLNIIAYKVKRIGAHTRQRTQLAIEDSKTYRVLDKHIHFDKRYKDLALLLQHAHDASLSLVTPAYQAVSYSYDKITNEYLVTLRDVSSQIIKERASQIRQRYSVLKDATFHLRDRVLEIRLNKETLIKYNKVAREQIAALYQELSGLDAKKIQVYGGKAYQKALEIVKGRGTRAIKNKEEAKPQEKSQGQDNKKSQ